MVKHQEILILISLLRFYFHQLHLLTLSWDLIACPFVDSGHSFLVDREASRHSVGHLPFLYLFCHLLLFVLACLLPGSLITFGLNWMAFHLCHDQISNQMKKHHH